MGCGTGALCAAIVDHCAPASVVGVEPSEGFLKAAQEHLAGRAVLHPTCTLIKMGGLGDLLSVARAHAEEVVVPPGAECCGFAGDRGFLVPELTRAATAGEAAEVAAMDGAGTGLYSTCRTCEIGMGRAVGRPYASLVHLVRAGLLGG